MKTHIQGKDFDSPHLAQEIKVIYKHLGRKVTKGERSRCSVTGCISDHANNSLRLCLSSIVLGDIYRSASCSRARQRHKVTGAARGPCASLTRTPASGK